MGIVRLTHLFKGNNIIFMDNHTQELLNKAKSGQQLTPEEKLELTKLAKQQVVELRDWLKTLPKHE